MRWYGGRSLLRRQDLVPCVGRVGLGLGTRASRGSSGVVVKVVSGFGWEGTTMLVDGGGLGFSRGGRGILNSGASMGGELW